MDFTRNDFMEFFRNDEKLNLLSVDDRVEVFSTILTGSSDFTKKLLDEVLCDYGVTNLKVIELNNNVKLNYLYRDSGNYKSFGSAVFSNPDRDDIDLVESIIRDKLIDNQYFYPDKAGIPLLHSCIDSDMWHEYENVELTAEIPTENMSIKEFISRL